jgi:Ca-activated chloride channel family protein
MTRLRIAALLLATTVAVGAAAKLRHDEGTPQPPHPPRTTPVARTYSAGATVPVHLTGTLEGTAVLPRSDRNVRMELTVGADSGGKAVRAARTDLVVVLDRSGSMGGEKIEYARAAVRSLVGALGKDDRFALVTYSDGAQVAIPLSAATDRDRWFPIIDSIRPDGGTAMSNGLDAALAIVDGARIAGSTPRVVLISDGLANQGDFSREGLVARAARATRGEYALSTVGVGADFDEGLMAALADAGSGNFHFLASAEGLDRILRSEFATGRDTIATGLRIAIEPGPGVAVVDASGYPLQNEGGTVSFSPGTLFDNQERRIWVTFQVPADAKGDVPLGRVALEYVANGARGRIALSEVPTVTATADESLYYGALDQPSWERSVTVDQYNALRRKVAEAVKDGRERDALGEIQKYRAQLESKNAQVKSEVVQRHLAKAYEFQQRLDDAASGAKPMAPMETKALQAQGYEEGRPGAKHQ